MKYKEQPLPPSLLSRGNVAAKDRPLAATTSSIRSLARDFPLLRVSATIVGLLGLPVAAQASFTPPNLPSGSAYRLIFVTSDTTDATSTAISTYNTFVTTAAGFDSTLPSTSWSAIASTSTTSALNNVDAVCSTIGCQSAPIYLVDGTLVANNQSDLFSQAAINPISEDENGTSYSGYVWTGSTSGGNSSSAAMGSASAEVGNNTFSFPSDYFDIGFSYTNATKLPLYAISGQLTVPAPEPMSGSLLLVGGVATGLVRRLRRKCGRPAA